MPLHVTGAAQVQQGSPSLGEVNEGPFAVSYEEAQPVVKHETGRQLVLS